MEKMKLLHSGKCKNHLREQKEGLFLANGFLLLAHFGAEIAAICIFKYYAVSEGRVIIREGKTLNIFDKERVV